MASTLTSHSPTGRVWLIGAGPGDPELLTLKAARILRECDIWLIDDLVDDRVSELATAGTRIIPVGKRGGCRSTPQSFILRAMARYARQGHTVARVKGGDPFIFGRGGEELTWLAQQNIPAQAIAGITAGLAAGSALGLPLTHRGISRGVALVTAHTMDGSQPDWRALAASGLTVVCYMGMNGVDDLIERLLQAGFAPNLPACVVQSVSCPNQRHITTTVQALATTVATHALSSPAVIILGEAVQHQQAIEPAALYSRPQAQPTAATPILCATATSDATNGATTSGSSRPLREIR